MREPNWDWIDARDELKETLTDIGHPAELGDLIARHLGSPRAIRRMAAYLRYERPASVETIADEMLTIRSEIDAWREKTGRRTDCPPPDFYLEGSFRADLVFFAVRLEIGTTGSRNTSR